MDFSYLFESEKIYSENILSFYNLLTNKNIEELITPQITENDFFLYLIYPNYDIVKHLLKQDELIRFRFIDFFDNNINMIEQRDRKIQEFLIKNDIEHLNVIYNNIKTDLDNQKLNQLKPLIEDIDTNKNMYLQYILSQLWDYDVFNIINIEYLTIRLIILYYFNKFMIMERSNDLNIESPDYIEFIQLLIKYKHLYNVNDDYTTITFRSGQNYEPNAFKDAEAKQHTMDEKEKIILHFFYSLTNPELINQNVISWFYIFFSSFIPNAFHNDILYIILGFKKNTIGFVTQILKSFNKDYNEITEVDKENIIKIIKNDYIFKQNEIVENAKTIKDNINNIILINNYNKNFKNKFQLLTNIDKNEITVERMFFIIDYDPLKESWQSIANKIKKTEMKFQNMDIDIFKLLQIYNSVQLKDFIKKTTNVILPNGQYKQISLKTGTENLNISDHNNLNLFDINIIFYNLLLFLNNFEIIIFNNKLSLYDSMNKYNTDINTIKQLFQSIYPSKDFYNGYKGFK